VRPFCYASLLEAIELQESARPYHDWKERINAECYAPNAAARILDKEKGIVKIVNNYVKISFNFGPTLLSWIEANDPAVYKAILDADAESAQVSSGHGSALAQPYHHMIMPLANARDKYTQAFWGIRDFEHRFGRRPEGGKRQSLQDLRRDHKRSLFARRHGRGEWNPATGIRGRGLCPHRALSGRTAKNPESHRGVRLGRG
jgi:alpha-amylase/alpha-mannosidase (GH57 family)